MGGREEGCSEHPVLHADPVGIRALRGSTLLEPHKLNHQLALPNKLFSYLMAGLPVLATDLPELGAVVRGEQVGVLVADHSVEAITRAVAGVLGERSRLTAMRDRARRAAERQFHWEREQQNLLQIYDRL